MPLSSMHEIINLTIESDQREESSHDEIEEECNYDHDGFNDCYFNDSDPIQLQEESDHCIEYELEVIVRTQSKENKRSN